jgi:hypothetical protein
VLDFIEEFALKNRLFFGHLSAYCLSEQQNGEAKNAKTL